MMKTAVEIDLPADRNSIAIEAGDYIKITTMQGNEHIVEVTSVTADAIEGIFEGEPKSFDIGELEKIEIMELTVGAKVSALLLGVAYGVLLVGIADVITTAIIL